MASRKFMCRECDRQFSQMINLNNPNDPRPKCEKCKTHNVFDIQSPLPHVVYDDELMQAGSPRHDDNEESKDQSYNKMVFKKGEKTDIFNRPEGFEPRD